MSYTARLYSTRGWLDVMPMPAIAPCLCGGKKRRGFPVCRACYAAAPKAVRADAYSRDTETRHAAIAELKAIAISRSATVPVAATKDGNREVNNPGTLNLKQSPIAAAGTAALL